MKIIKLSQTEDRESWLQLRRGNATGQKAKGLKPLSRGTDRTPAGFWQLLGERVSVAPDGEDADARGQRLENEALELTAIKFKLDLDLDPGMWVSDDDENMSVSPDGAERGDRPSFAAENKSLASALHLKYIIKDIRAQREPNYSPINSIPNEAHNAYREQVIQYFVVNGHLKTLYFTLYDDRIVLDKYIHHVVVINRGDIKDEIAAQRAQQLVTLQEVNNLIAEMAG